MAAGPLLGGARRIGDGPPGLAGGLRCWPFIRADIGGGPTLLQWLLAGYTLAMAIGLITGGRLGDLCGRRPVLLAGIAGFTIGSILCSIATQPGELIAFRVVQGLLRCGTGIRQ